MKHATLLIYIAGHIHFMCCYVGKISFATAQQWRCEQVTTRDACTKLHGLLHDASEIDWTVVHVEQFDSTELAVTDSGVGGMCFSQQILRQAEYLYAVYSINTEYQNTGDKWVCLPTCLSKTWRMLTGMDQRGHESLSPPTPSTMHVQLPA